MKRGVIMLAAALAMGLVEGCGYVSQSASNTVDPSKGGRFQVVYSQDFSMDNDGPYEIIKDMVTGQLYLVMNVGHSGGPAITPLLGKGGMP